ncbi:MAG: P-II family nitrogen regulator [Clostridia bacterium]|nr:P-II family nitrogen regulator [Clostridia bacterium]
MKGLKYLIVITKREYSEDYLDFFHRHDVKSVITLLCNGTASESTLSLLGLEKTEKVMFQTMITEDKMGEILKGLIVEMDISSLGNGIAVLVPLDSVGGMSSLKHFVGENPIEKKEKENMTNTESKTVLIITIVNRGNVSVVMDAARGAGAGGGTVVRAVGTGAEIAKFFGVSISEEKEMIYIVARRDTRDVIMKAIMEKAGTNTDAHGILFSLPIDSVVGLKAFENID